MTLKVKAIEKKLKFNKDSEGIVFRYVMQPKLYTSLTQAKVIKAWAKEGHSVARTGLRTMRFGLRAKAVETHGERSRELSVTARG